LKNVASFKETMGSCSSKTPDLSPQDLRLGAVEYDMKTLQRNFEILHEHLEILTQKVRDEMETVYRETEELKGCPMGLQQRQHVAQLNTSVQKVLTILNPPPCESCSEESVEACDQECVVECDDE
jgi:hypothetical protein